MAMCARKSLLRKLRQRRKVFYGKKSEGFFERLESGVDQKTVVVHDQRKQSLARAQVANRSMVISR